MISKRTSKKKSSPSHGFHLGSDEASQAPEGVFLKSNPHPRAYGDFARVLGKYVRDEKVLPMSDAIHRLERIGRHQSRLDHRGFLKEECLLTCGL